MARPPLFLFGKDLPVLVETPHFLIINKPAGLASHPGPHTQDSVESRLTPQKRGGPWLAHRLDRDTAGCLLIARRKTALIQAQHAFAARHTKKTYWAIVHGYPKETRGRITVPLRRFSQNGRWHMEATTASTKDAQHAETSWRLLGSYQNMSWLELSLHTGRTHQARIHCQALGTPIIGDSLYGAHPSQGAPMQLLAQKLHLPLSTETLTAEASPPASMQALIQHITSHSV